MKSLFLYSAACALLLTAAAVADDKMASSSVQGLKGAQHGAVTLQQTPAGVLIKARLRNLPSGVHAFHLHEKGVCDADEMFKTAGGHIADGKEHGFLVEGGPHPGDMPNIHVPEEGALTVEVLNTYVSLEGSNIASTLRDEDGSSLVIHIGADDYKTQPSGDAHERIACAVIAEPQ